MQNIPVVKISLDKPKVPPILSPQERKFLSIINGGWRFYGVNGPLPYTLFWIADS